MEEDITSEITLRFLISLDFILYALERKSKQDCCIDID